ncbi:hypothetical protein BX600DRAFT_473528 [Xylariales sp. PMI_506]|nr:hypothetical protein BX600DRAFT_473528 [Xylariales sp. PMI_506]
MFTVDSIGDAIAVGIAVLYTLAGQAHFTARFTPDLARNIEQMTPNSHRAFWFIGASDPAIKCAFGAFDLIAAALLWRKKTRKTGLAMAVIGFSGGLYGQLFNDDDITQVATFLGLSLAGFLLYPKRR